jgi:hypothetical protein
VLILLELLIKGAVLGVVCPSAMRDSDSVDTDLDCDGRVYGPDLHEELHTQ